MADEPSKNADKNKGKSDEKTDDMVKLSLLSVSNQDLLTPKAEAKSVASDLLHSFGHSLIQSPLDAMAQLKQGSADGESSKAVKLMEAPKPAEFKSLNWGAQQAGHIAGSLVWIVGLHSGVSAGFGKNMMRAEAATLGAQSAQVLQKTTTRTLLESGITGTLYGGLLTPLKSNESDFWTGRARNAVVTGTTFTTLTGAGLSVRSLGTSLGERSLVGAALRGDVLSNTLAGIPAGLVSSNFDSFARTGHLASAQQNTEQVAGFMALGFTMGLAQKHLFRPAAIANENAAKAQELGLDTTRSSAILAERSLGKSEPKQVAESNEAVQAREMLGEKSKPESKAVPKVESKLDVDGRAIDAGFREKVANAFPRYSEAQLKEAKIQTEKELSQIKSSVDGQSVLDRLNSSPLSAEQKGRVISSLAQVREEYVRQRNGGKMDADQEVNWIHTQGELGRVIDVGLKTKAPAHQIEDALLASMFSDSVKAKTNFFTHHLDGALAADHVLRPMLGGNFTAARLEGIVQAIKEHQIGPPEFMATLYGGRIRGALLQENGAVSPAEADALKKLFMKMANPLSEEVPKFRSSSGGTYVQFTAEEQALLKRAGVDSWSVPDARNPWNSVSRMLIDGDSIDNYATPGGFGKIAKIRGPESDQWFKDRRIDSDDLIPGNDTSLGSARLSKKQAEKAMSSAGQELANQSVAETERAVAQAKQDVIKWLKSEKGIDAAKTEVPFLNKDLKYPARADAKAEADWWNIHRKPAAQRSAAEQQFYESQRYQGLSAAEQADFIRAGEIRDQFVDFLRRAQRVQADLPPDYVPAIR